jgi:hypothetical protein
VFPHNSGHSRNVLRFEIGAVAKPTNDLRAERINAQRLFFEHREYCACIPGSEMVGCRIYGITRYCFDIRFSKLWSRHSIAWQCSITLAAAIWGLKISETHLKSFVGTLEELLTPTFKYRRTQCAFKLIQTILVTQPHPTANSKIVSNQWEERNRHKIKKSIATKTGQPT